MGCCRSNPNQTKDEKDQELIELSFKLNTPLPHPCIGLKQFVVRDGSGTSEVDGLSTLLDDLDNILEVIRIKILSWDIKVSHFIFRERDSTRC